MWRDGYPGQARSPAGKCWDVVADRLGLGGGFHIVFAQVFQHHDKFIAAQAGHRVAFADAGFQVQRHLRQQQVALVVAERVVEGFEVVNINKQQGAVARMACAGMQRLLQIAEYAASKPKVDSMPRLPVALRSSVVTS